jgi:hypothetical protein
MQVSLRTMAWSLLCFGGVFGCASQGAPAKGQDTAAEQHSSAEKPTQAPSDAGNPTAAAEKRTSSDAKPAAQPSTAASNDGPGDGLRKASRPPAELITGGNVVYVFNFKESAVGTAAQEACQREAGGDPRAERECFEKARSQVPVESVRFVKDKSDQYWWVTYNRYKGNLLKWHRIQFMPGAETDSTISLTLIGKDKGIAPLARVPRALAINLPNDYSIVIQDPELGAMAYDAKIGLIESD